MYRCNNCYHTSSFELEHSYCHTCGKEVCEGGDADVHRSIGHDVQSGLCERSEAGSSSSYLRNRVARARVVAAKG